MQENVTLPSTYSVQPLLTIIITIIIIIICQSLGLSQLTVQGDSSLLLQASNNDSEDRIACSSIMDEISIPNCLALSF